MKKNNSLKTVGLKLLFLMLILHSFSVFGRLNASNPGITEPNSITLTINNVRTSSFSANWSAVPGATSYKIWASLFHYESYWYVPLLQYNGKVLSAGTTNVDITNASAPYPYTSKCRFTVIAYNGTTKIDESFKEFYLLLDAPEVKSISNITSSSFTINWTQRAGSQYDTRITVSKKNGAIWEAVSGFPKTINKPADVYTVTGVQGGTEYRVSLQFYIDNWFDGNIGWSDWTEDMILTKPGAPVAIAATSIAANTFTANWNASTGATGYKFYMKEKASGKQVYNGTSTPFTQFLTSGLEAGIQYDYQVSAVNETGESAKSNSITVTTLVLPTPVAIIANSITTSSFNARWNAVADATGYLLSVSDGNVWSDYNVAGTSQSITGLQSNKGYQYKVKAKFGSSLSAFSNVIDVTTKPTAPVAMAANNITTTSFNVNWNAVSGATEYKLWIFNNTTSSFLTEYFPKSISNVLTYNVKGLTPGNNYDYYVQVVTSTGESVVSNSINVTTLATPPVNTYTVSITGLPEGAGIVSGDGYYASGQEVTITATPAVGSTFVNWTENGTQVSTSASYTFTLTANRIFVANFILQEQDYTVTSSASPLVGGSTSISSGTYSSGQSVTFTATPASGYNFVNWTENGNQVSALASYTFTVTANRILVANFIQQNQKVTLTSLASPLEGGITSIPSGTYLSGQEVTIRATPAAGYTFVNWTNDGIVVSTIGRYKFIIIANCTLVANFTQLGQNYTVTSTTFPLEGGTNDITSGTYPSGQEVIITATPSDGYNFVNWTESGMEVSTSPSYTFNISSNCNLVANFTRQTQNYTVTSSVQPLEGGTTDIPSGTYPSGELVSITAIPAEGYSFLNWTENGEEVSTSANYSFAISANHNFIANFIRQVQNYTVLSSTFPLEGGSTDIPSGAYPSGELVTITATPAEGYSFFNWTENGEVISDSVRYTFTITINRNLVANFVQQVKNYSITSSAFPYVGGTTSIPSGTYPSGELVTNTATPSEGYNFVNWTENGEEVSTSAEYTFNVFSSRILVANFSKKSFTISTEPLPVIGGSTNISSGSFLYNEDVTLIATPTDGYVFVNWTESGIVKASTPNYIFNVTVNRHLVANFAVKTYSVTAEAKPAEGGTTNVDSRAYEKGQTSSVSAIPNEGYEFVNWTINGTEVSTSTDYSFSVTEDVFLTANFILKKHEVKISSNNPAWGYTNFASKSFNYGEMATISAMPNWNCQFINWTENGTEVTKEAYYSFEVLGDRTLIANFEKANGINDWDNPALNIYPNPATDFITISGIVKGSVIELVTLSGNLVYFLVAESSIEKIDILSLRKGFYFVLVENNNKQITTKLMIE
jgi:hypothetical protein